jgi:hypothetical protein
MGKIKWHTFIHSLPWIDTRHSVSSNDAAFRLIMNTRSLSTHHIPKITLRQYCRSARQAQKTTCIFSIKSWNIFKVLQIFLPLVYILRQINSVRNLPTYFKVDFNIILLLNCLSYDWNIPYRFPNNILLVHANPSFISNISLTYSLTVGSTAHCAWMCDEKSSISSNTISQKFECVIHCEFC